MQWRTLVERMGRLTFLLAQSNVIRQLICLVAISSIAAGCAHQDSTREPALDSTTASQSAVVVAKSIQFASSILGEDREVLIALPEGYAESAARYPVLYVLDGRQNLPHVLGSVDVLTRTGGIPPTIVVGITGTDRDKDYSTSAVASVPTSGGGAKFLSFIEQELLPFVDQHYRTMPFKAIEGHSLGGALVTHALLTNTDLFDAYIIMSPALWWDERDLLARAKSFFQSRTSLPKAVFLGIGAQDGYEMREDLAKLAAIVDEANIPDVRLAHSEFDQEGHMSAPLQINYFGLKHIYGDMNPPNATVETFDADVFIAHEQRIRKKYGTNARQTAETYVRLAFRLLDAGRFSDAIVVLEQNAASYPGYHRNHWWLGDAHEKNSDLQAALANYQLGADLAAQSGDPMVEQYQAHVARISALIAKSN